MTDEIRSTYDVESPHDFADLLENGRFPDDTPRPRDVVKHPQGQTYVNFGSVGDSSDEIAATALYVIQAVERAGLRAEVDTRHSISIFEPKPTCGHDDCYADAQGGRKPENPDLCSAHGRLEKHERMKEGLPPRRGRD